jgi:hypothetical protein
MSQAQRRLSARRGSVSASDPFGQHASLNHDSNRSSSSTLTIVRVLDPSSQASGTTGTGSSSVNLSDPPTPVLHRRSLRHPGGTTPSSTSADGATGRLSFAFSSFAPNSSTLSSSSTPAPAVTSTPGRRATSPSTSPRLRSSSPSQFSRRLSSSGSSPFAKPNLTPDQLVELARQSTNPRYVPSSPAITPSTPHPPALPSPGGSVAGEMTAPATFTPLPDDVYLPFVDRPAEVAQLLSTPPTARLFSLLAQTFPRKQGPENPDPTFSTDPATWTFGTLRVWLTTVDRQIANDALWVRNARKCVLSHSELIWERLKGALGVPPELEVDGEHEAENVIEGDSCPSGVPIMAHLAFEDSDMPHASSLFSDEPISQDDSTPSSPTHLSIEPILASNASVSTTGSVHPPPLSLPSTLSQSASLGHVDGLQDIGEEAEDEDCADTEESKRESQPAKDSLQIHGLRIATSPVPSSPAFAPQSFSHPTSPVVHPNDFGRNSADLRSSLEGIPPLTRRISRTSSHGSVSSLGRPMFR